VLTKSSSETVFAGVFRPSTRCRWFPACSVRRPCEIDTICHSTHTTKSPAVTFFRSLPRAHSAPARDPVREQVVALRQRNLSVYDIQRELAAGQHPIGINALTILLREEGFARLPRRRDEERPAALKADSPGVADVRRPDPRLRVRSGCRRARFAPPSPACTFRTPRVFDEYVMDALSSLRDSAAEPAECQVNAVPRKSRPGQGSRFRCRSTGCTCATPRDPTNTRCW
jgi:hypothetical protein